MTRDLDHGKKGELCRAPPDTSTGGHIRQQNKRGGKGVTILVETSHPTGLVYHREKK